jgi:O-acetyl-ADP-ribose deacetylase (regulator of RNase III)
MTSVNTSPIADRLSNNNHVIDSETALEKIIDNSPHLPFFVGAGISYPEVPLAYEIVQMLARERIYGRHVSKGRWKKQFPDDHEADFESWKNSNKWLESKDSYSEAMLEAFGEDIDDVAVVNQYFQDNLLLNAVPNFCHYALALLMKYNYINKTCITTNFDRLIEMAFMRIEGCDCIPIRTEDEIDIWDHDRHYIIKVHGDGHFYNMKQTKTQTSDWDDKFKELLLRNRQHFSGLVIVGLAGHEKSIKDFFIKYMESYKKKNPNPGHHRGILWGVRTKRPLVFERDKSSNERDEFIRCIENEVNHDIIELFLDASPNHIPFYFFPIANARHFFFHLTQKIIDHKSANPMANSSIEIFHSEIQSFYGGDEWVFSSLRNAKDKLNLSQAEMDMYLERLDKANERVRTAKSKTPRTLIKSSSKQYQNSIVEVLVGDISRSETEIIVSSDDILLMMNDGVAGAIRTAGGGQIIRDIQKFESKLPLRSSEVLITNAGRLQAKYVFHAGILDPRDPNQNLGQLVREAVSKCLELMKVLRCQSITFPLLASGTAATSSFGVKESTICILETIKAFLDTHSSEEFKLAVCVYDENTIRTNNLEYVFTSYFA